MKTKILLLFLLTTLSGCNFMNSSDKVADKNLQNIKAKESETINKSNEDSGELIASFEIGIKANQEEAKDFEDGIVPWISIENPEKDINRLIDPEKMVVETNEVTLVIDYPLNKPANFILKSSQKGFTAKQLVLEISKKYSEIYAEEEKSAKTKTVPVDKREGLINRNETDGKYGVWGHDIGDLDLSSIEVYKTKDGKIQIVLGIES
jgi:hypothetical protein